MIPLRSLLSPPSLLEAAEPSQAPALVPPPKPTLAELTSVIRRGHGEVEAGLASALAKAIGVGKALVAAKRQVGHGNFEDYVAVECRIAMRTAQNYMRLARHEAEVQQLLAAKAQGPAYLTMGQALKLIGRLGHRKRGR
jgi:Protein of unknown function (DUF3102)